MSSCGQSGDRVLRDADNSAWKFSLNLLCFFFLTSQHRTRLMQWLRCADGGEEKGGFRTGSSSSLTPCEALMMPHSGGPGQVGE